MRTKMITYRGCVIELSCENARGTRFGYTINCLNRHVTGKSGFWSEDLAEVAARRWVEDRLCRVPSHNSLLKLATTYS